LIATIYIGEEQAQEDQDQVLMLGIFILGETLIGVSLQRTLALMLLPLVLALALPCI